MASLTPGLLVEHASYGIGKVMEADSQYAVIYFPTAVESDLGPYRRFNVTAPQIRIAPQQSNAALDAIPIVTGRFQASLATKAGPASKSRARSRAAGSSGAPDVWWLAISDSTSYAELKEKRVIAQGWKHFGDLTRFIALMTSAPESFEAAMFSHAHAQAQKAGKEPTNADRGARVMVKFLAVEPGDLFVGIEGTIVRGICKLERSVAASYKYDGSFGYAQTIGHPVDWLDWDDSIMGRPPEAPAQSVLGLARVQNERALVTAAWRQRQSRASS